MYKYKYLEAACVFEKLVWTRYSSCIMKDIYHQNV